MKPIKCRNCGALQLGYLVCTVCGTQDPGGETVAERTDDKHVFSSGASSSGNKPRYDLIPQRPMIRVARRFGEGAQKHGENNWRKGLKDRAFLLDRANHAFEHLHNLISKGLAWDPSEDDDAAAVILNMMFIMEAQEDNNG